MADGNVGGRARRARRIWIGAGSVVLAGLVFAFWPRAAAVDTAVVDRGTVRVDLVDEARTRMHEVYVVSAPVAGRVLRVDVEPGDVVAADAVVARMAQAAAGFLDTRTDLQARAAVNAAEASLRAAEAQADLADRELVRARRLYEAKLVADAAVEEAEARAVAARAQNDAARAELARARSAVLAPERVAGGSVLVRAPVAGTVLRVPQESESVIAAGTPLVEIGDPSRLEVVAEYLSQDAVRMRPGAPAQVENWGGPPLPARVERIEPVARTKVSALGVEEQRTNVILAFEDSPTAAGLGHAFRVDARVRVAEFPDAIRVPLGALFRRGEDWAAFKVERGRAVLTTVQVGAADGAFRVIESGLSPGDRVIVFPGRELADGSRVRPNGD